MGMSTVFHMTPEPRGVNLCSLRVSPKTFCGHMKGAHWSEIRPYELSPKEQEVRFADISTDLPEPRLSGFSRRTSLFGRPAS
jgi:hypothetical protein